MKGGRRRIWGCSFPVYPERGRWAGWERGIKASVHRDANSHPVVHLFLIPRSTHPSTPARDKLERKFTCGYTFVLIPRSRQRHHPARDKLETTSTSRRSSSALCPPRGQPPPASFRRVPPWRTSSE